MSAQVHYFRIGAFVIGGFVLGVAAIIVFGGIDLTPPHFVVVETYLDESVQGLDIGSRVKAKGVEIGQVDEIGFVHAAYELSEEDRLQIGNMVFVRFTIFSDDLEGLSREEFLDRAAVMIDRGMRARLASQGVTGIKYIELDTLDPDRFRPFQPTWTPRDLYLPSAPGAFSEIMDSIDELTQKLGNLSVEEMAAEIQGMVRSLQEGIEAARIGDIGQNASIVLEDIHRLLEGPELQETMANLRDTTASTREIASKLDRLIESEEVKESVTNLADSTENIKRATEDLPAVIARLDTTLARLEEFLSSGQPDLEAAMSEIRMTVRNIRELTDTAKRYPSSLVFGEKPDRAKPEGGSK